MNIIKKSREYLNNPEYDINERIFALLSVIGLFGLLLAIIGGFFTGEAFWSMVVAVSCFVAFIFLIILAFKFHKVKIVSVIVAFVLSVIFIPLNFFTSGAIHGGAICWNVFVTVYIGMMLSGKIRVFFLILETVSVIVTYYVYYRFPNLATERGAYTEFADSIVSFFLVSFIIVFMIAFQSGLLLKENERTVKQKDEIDDLNRAQNTFFSSMSHEIRTPINTIVGLNEMILRENASDEINEDAINIRSASQLLLHLINDILDMSKMQSGQMKLTESSYYAADMISDVTNMIMTRANEKGLEFNIDVAPGIPEELFGDDVRIRQILINVLNNAVKYTSEGSVALSINAEPDTEKIVRMIFTISDTGMGIRKENIPYLFDVFKRVDEQKNARVEGSGLGLSIVKQLIDMMGGKISVNSVYTKGSTFVIEIPQKAVGEKLIGEVDFFKTKRTNELREYSASFVAPDASVLVVDDTPANLMVVAKLLRETKVNVTTVSSAEEALSKTLENHYHVIFMDHLMPDMDGIECLKRIRNQTGGMCRDSKIVALTANAGSDKAKLYMREGFDTYLVKPVRGVELEDELIKLLPSELVTITDAKTDIEKNASLWRDVHKARASVVITTDSVASIPKDVLDKFGIRVIPIRIQTSDGVFRDGIDIDSEGLVKYMTEEDKRVIVRPVSVERFESFFASCLKDAKNVIHISGSDVVNKSSYPNAVEAAKTFDNVHVVNSGHLAGALGAMCMLASKAAAEGVETEELLGMIDSFRDSVKAEYILQNLDYMYESGQIGKLSAKIVRAFSLHPVVYVNETKMKLYRAYMGGTKSAWSRYIKRMLKNSAAVENDVVAVFGTNLKRQDREFIQEQIMKHVKFKSVQFYTGSSVMALNCGPGSFGMVTYKKQKR